MLKYLLRQPLLNASVMCAVSLPASARLHFDPSMLSGNPVAVADLSLFSSGGSQLPGVYLVDAYLNGSRVATRSVRFVAVQAGEAQSAVRDNTGLQACLSREELSDMGVNVPAFAELAAQPDEQCVTPGLFIPQAWTAFDFQKMRLDISIPQAAMRKQPDGWIAPERWDEGINAALASWRFSGSESRGKYGNSRSQFLNLTSGVNLGAWRLRDNSTWSYQENDYGRRQHWQHLNTWLQRAIIPLRSELTLGDGTTSGDVFDTVSFRGVHLATDDSMYPASMRGYAPVIRGTAGSSAEVSIRQNGHEIYRINVAPGAFVIDDLPLLSSGGDLEVMITEADGQGRMFTVPYSSVPVLQREGHLRYGITAARYRNVSVSYDDPLFMQATLLWGMPHNVTAYGGTRLAENYRAATLGMGFNTGVWGAVSADITHADSILADGSRHRGESLRFLYGRSLVSTGTTLQLAGYRYSTRGFHTLDDTALKSMAGWTGDSEGAVDAAGRPVKRDWINYYNLNNNKRERLQVSLSQQLGNVGSLSLTGSRQTYWDEVAATSSLQAAFSSSLGRASYNISYAHTRYNGQPRADNVLWFSLSLPLDGWLSQNVWATYSTHRGTDGQLSHRAGISGSLPDRENVNWSASQGYSRQDGNSGDAAVDYRGTYGNASAEYSYSRNYRQWRYGTSGSAVLHREGATFGQPLGTTNILVAAPGAAGLPVDNATGVQTDWRGYTVVPWASQYRESRVALDVSKLDSHADIDNAVSRVVPTQGALVRADFRVRTGVRALITLTHNGKPVPFGTTVSVADGGGGLVGDDGQVFLSGLKLKGEINAQWGNRPDQRCSARYTLPEAALKSPVTWSQVICN
ncbi:Outer membrane usher protein FimD precursor [Klebsiella electrica]|uniref:fimbria/pilus outer membrane usher protein n=1 Tax=Klebsiella electrica TaxID=1259973 RepID=UPI001164BB2B|nr:fimbria/pilus outer membrane usher protein [Klebsiella electrica]QDI10510.1 Outer membrane usher protein FimD precursor [Klebsiella electrica]